MASKVIYMDGVATAHLRADGSVRIELAAGNGRNDLGNSLVGVMQAFERRMKPEQADQLSGPQLVATPGISLEGRSTPAGAADRAS